MAMLKIQTWRPDTHPGHSLEIEWEYDREAGRDTGREHRGVSVLYPDGTHIDRDTDGADAVQEQYLKIRAENVMKNRAFSFIVDALPSSMKKQVLDSDGDPVLDDAGQPRLTVKDKHRPRFAHLGGGLYEFVVPGIDEATFSDLSAKLGQEFGGAVTLRNPAG